MSKNNKSTPKNKKRDQQNIAKDMWQNLLNNPLPNPTSPNTQASGSSSQPTGFANLPPIANPFNLAPDDPRNNYQFQGWYQNTQWSPPQSQFPHHTQWSQPQPHFYQNTQWSPQHPHFSPSSSNPNHQQMNFTVPQTLEESSDEANPEPENEPEPESEPEPEAEAPNDKKRGKKVQKGRNAQKGKRVQIRWTDDEARILAERWIHCSENGVQGKNQSNESFWAKVINGYNSCVSQERNLNQLSGKWNKISHDSKTFQALYKHYKEICPQSGADENDVLNATRKAFRQQVGRAFIYESSWNVLKHYPKFFAEPGVMANEDCFQPFVTDLDADEFPTGTALDANMKRLFQDDYLRRPPGRKAAKSTASSSAGSSSRSVHSEKIDTLEAVRQTALAQQEAIKMIKENAIKKAAYKALSFLCKKLPKKASKKEIKMLKNARKEVVTLYQDKYGNNESDEDEQENANETDESSSD